MIRRYIFILIILFSTSIYAQDGEIKGLINTDDFPTVSFVWHEYNPEPLKTSAFTLREDGELMPVNVTRKEPSLFDTQISRSVVILWEDMYCNGNMYNFTQQMLINFIDTADIVTGRDYIYIAAFNRHRNSEAVLKPITDGFTSSPSILRESIRNYHRSTETYPELSNQSDVYPAILEALNILQKRDEKEVKGVFVITAGRPLESSATNSAVEVQKRAKEKHIPLYIYQYAISHGKSTVLEGLGTDTYGGSVILGEEQRGSSVRYAAARLNIGYTYLPSHYNGQDYVISYHSNLKRGGKETILELNVNSYPYSITLRPAKHSFGSWCVSYWYICLLFLLVIVGGIVTICLYVQKQKKQHEADAAAIGRLKDEQTRSQQQVQNQLNEQASRIEQYKAQEVAKQAERRQADSQSLLESMRKKNIFPRIHYTDKNNNMFVYEMRKPEILIGRGLEADVRLDDSTVSRKHASICFVGDGFEIKDLGSSNGTIVSGRPVQGSEILNDHDIINMGNALLTFYL